MVLRGCGPAHNPHHVTSERPMTPKVLLFLTSTAGGVGEHGLQLARRLPKHGIDLHVAFGPGYPLDDDLRNAGPPVYELSVARTISPLRNLRAGRELRGLIREHRYDAIVMEASMAGVLGRIVGALDHVPVRVMVLQAWASQPNQPKLKRTIYEQAERSLDRFTTHYVAVSNAMKTWGSERGILSPEKVTVIPNAVEAREIPQFDQHALRAELGLRPDRKVVMTGGRFEPQKAFPDLLNAFASVLKRLPETELLFVGDGPLRKELESLTRTLGIDDSVHFTGWRTDMAHLMRISDVFALASLWESFGIILAEANLMERPVVATASDGIPETIKDGETGILTPPRNPEAMASALIQLLADPPLAQSMGQAGRKRVLAHFNANDMAVTYADFIKSCCKPTRADG